MNQVVSKIGPHSTGPRRYGYGEFVRRINDAGRRLSVVKCRDDFGAIDEPMALWPDIVTVGAFTEFDGLPVDMNRFFSRAALNPRVKYWEILNEINGIYSEQADKYIAVAPEFKRRGMGLALFSCASGTPILPGESVSFVRRVISASKEAYIAVKNDSVMARTSRLYAETPYEAIARACRYMLDNKIDAILCLHEYYTPGGGTIGRYKALADYLESVGALLPIVISEFGSETYPGSAEFIRIAKEADQIYMADPRVIGATDWTLGGGGWGGSNFERALPQLAEYIATVQPVDPPPPDDTVSFRGTCPSPKWDAVRTAALNAGATIEKVTP